jgi:hypothetical protein
MDDQKKTLFPPPSKVAKFMAARDVPPNSRLSVPPYQEVDGYRHANVFLRFSQEGADEEPMDLGVIFAFDADGTMGARRYVSVETNAPAPQTTHFIEVSGSGSWHGPDAKFSSFVARLPVMGPFMHVIAHNRAPYPRKASIWAYLTY